jgi:hypothetical protein
VYEESGPSNVRVVLNLSFASQKIDSCFLRRAQSAFAQMSSVAMPATLNAVRSAYLSMDCGGKEEATCMWLRGSWAQGLGSHYMCFWKGQQVAYLNAIVA